MARLLEQKQHQVHRTESLADRLSFRDRDRDGFRTDNLNSVARKSIMPVETWLHFWTMGKEIMCLTD
jgi:hypothetical protein